MTIDRLLKMQIGQHAAGGFVLTVKKTKKSVKLPNGRYIHTVVLFDNTGEMLADFKDPGGAGVYNPLIKGQQVKIIVAEIQAADSTGQAKVDQTGTKLFVDQFVLETSTQYKEEEYPDWRVTVRGKIRHGLVCAGIKAGRINMVDEIPKTAKKIIESHIEFIMTGE